MDLCLPLLPPTIVLGIEHFCIQFLQIQKEWLPKALQQMTLMSLWAQQDLETPKTPGAPTRAVSKLALIIIVTVYHITILWLRFPNISVTPAISIITILGYVQITLIAATSPLADPTQTLATLQYLWRWLVQQLLLLLRNLPAKTRPFPRMSRRTFCHVSPTWRYLPLQPPTKRRFTLLAPSSSMATQVSRTDGI